jgi:hypothetical protein
MHWEQLDTVGFA